MAAGVSAQIAVVTHHEDAVLGYHDFEFDIGRIDLVVVGIGIEIAASRSGDSR